METATAKIIKRLISEGWSLDRHGSAHDIYRIRKKDLYRFRGTASFRQVLPLR